MESFSPSDVEQIVKLVATAGDPTIEISIAERRTMLMEGLNRIIEGDIWAWSIASLCSDRLGDTMTLAMVDGGWKDEDERVNFIRALADHTVGWPLQGGFTELTTAESFKTQLMHEYIRQDVFDKFGQTWREWTGLHTAIISVYPLSNRIGSAPAFFRRSDRPEFTDRERAIVHVVVQQVDWMHRHGTDAPAGQRVVHLSPREREVLVQAMGGDSIKQIAQKLKLSEHTVGDYMKQIYKAFSVNSRAELLAQFISGGRH
jgi:DNA-binding CsgD family transcriptional regulator